MTDIAIAKGPDGGWDLLIVDGDLVLLTDQIDIVVQRVIYNLMTWLGESPYEPGAGVPWIELIFSGYAPLPGVVAYLTSIIRNTDGVDDVQNVDFVLDGRTLTIKGRIIVGADSANLDLQVAA